MGPGARQRVPTRAQIARLFSHLRRSGGRIGAGLISFMVFVVVVGGIAIFSIMLHGAPVNGVGAKASGTGVPTSVSPTPSETSGITVTCGTATTPACPSAPGQWIPIASDTPADVFAAFKTSSLYLGIQNSNATGKGDEQYDLSRPETGMFERELHVPGGLVVPDVYVIPFDNASGAIGYVAICNINATHTAIEAGEVVAVGTLGGQARPRGQLVPISANAAVAAVQAQRGILLRSNSQPSRVFVVVDASLIETGKSSWSGPAGPQNPFWLVPGADGHDYVVDTAGKAYLPTQLPIQMVP